jgi:hypothetical protein
VRAGLESSGPSLTPERLGRCPAQPVDPGHIHSASSSVTQAHGGRLVRFAIFLDRPPWGARVRMLVTVFREALERIAVTATPRVWTSEACRAGSHGAEPRSPYKANRHASRVGPGRPEWVRPNQGCDATVDPFRRSQLKRRGLTVEIRAAPALLGSDAIRYAAGAEAARAADATRWREMSVSSEVNAPGPVPALPFSALGFCSLRVGVPRARVGAPKDAASGPPIRLPERPRIAEPSKRE